MDKFEEAWKANRHVWESTKNLAKAMYLAGEEAQQAKVEELQKRVEVLVQKYKDEDRELKLIDEWEQSTIYGRIAIELEQALKGEG